MEDPTGLRSSRPLYWIGAIFVMGVLALIAWNVELPYLAFSSGPTSDATDAVAVEEATVYPAEGELLMLTVISQEVNLFEAVIAGFDPAIDLVRREALRSPDETDEEFRQRVLQQMDDSQQRAITVALGLLGYQMVPVDVIVVDLVEGVPAAEVLRVGDSIDSLDGAPIGSGAELSAALADREPGETVTLGITREGGTTTVRVDLVPRDDGGAMIGIMIRDLTEPPFPVSIRAGDIGGPSAGLVHTLAIVDALTPGELTKGRVVAGTGTIDYEGKVGNIGGVRQKVIGAEAAGAEFMLVPEGNYAEALTAPHRRIQIIPVATIEDALDFFEDLEAA